MKKTHTPLFSKLASLYHKAAFNPSRRAFLARSGQALIGAGASLVYTSCGNTPKIDKYKIPDKPLRKDVPIAIIGGGIAGLNCAWQLHKAGVAATVYEASKRAGGRILTHYNDSMGMGIFPEFGGDFIDSNHDDMLSLVKEHGLNVIDLSKEQQDSELKKDVFYFDNRSISEAEIIKEFKKIVPKLNKDIDSLGENYDTKAAIKLDHTPLEDYINGLTCAVWLKELLTAAYLAEYGMDVKNQSTLNMLTFINTLTDNGFEVFGDSDERYRIEGGNSKLIEAIVKALPPDTINKNKKLVSIKQQGELYELVFDEGSIVTAKYVVLTLPFTQLRKVSISLDSMSPKKRKCIDELGYGNNTKLVLIYDGRPWREGTAKAMGYLFHNTIVNGWDGSYVHTANNTKGAYICFFGGKTSEELRSLSTRSPMSPPWHSWRTLLPPEIISEMTNLLEAPFPGSQKFFQNAHVFVNWIDYPYMEASYSCYKTGQWTSIAGMESESVGNVFFAGEHCSRDFQGFMNGAAESGRVAGLEILKKMNNQHQAPTIKKDTI